MASRQYDNIQTLGKGLTLITGSFTTDGAGAVASQVDPGNGFVVSKPGATTGVYRVTFGKTTAVDQYPQAFYAGFATLEKSSASGYQLQVENAQVNNSTAPYVDILVKTPTSAVTATSGLEYLAAMQFAGLYPHLDGAAGISTADATDLASSKTLAKAIAVYLAAHDDDTSLHTAADTGALTCAAFTSGPPGDPADLAEVNAMYREMAADWYTHAQKVPTVHPGYDVAAIAPLGLQPANTDQDGTNAALNALKAAINQSVRSDYPTQTFVKSATVATTGAAAADLVSCTVTFGFIVSNSTANSITG